MRRVWSNFHVNQEQRKKPKLILIASREERELIARLRKIGSDSPDSVVLTADIIKLKRQISDLEIAKAKQEEDRDKQERELRHMIGLEKRRQEFEIEQTKRETTVKVREENLAADTKRFEENLKFNTQRFEKMESTLTSLLGDVLKRLPNVNMEIKRK